MLDDNIIAILKCYLNLPEITDPIHNPLSFAHICKQQHQDEQNLALQARYPKQYVYMLLDEDEDDTICYVHSGDNNDEQWYIAFSKQMLYQTVKWLHQEMGHPRKRQLC